MTNAKIKVVFGGLERIEAERMARELFTGQVRGDRIKHIVNQTKFRPISDTFDVETDSFSESESDSESDGWSSSRSFGGSAAEADLFSADEEATGRSRSRGEVSSEANSDSRVRSRSGSTSRGRSSSRVPITRHEEFEEETGRQFWGLEEEWEGLTATVHGLPKQEALIRAYNGPVLHVATPNIQAEQCDERLERFRTQVLQRCPNVKTIEVVTTEIEARQKQIADAVEIVENEGHPSKFKSFRE
jgi:hypothetical protein